jgi:hypothetical protein
VAKFYGGLESAGHKPKAHMFRSDGHGFGMQKHGTTSRFAGSTNSTTGWKPRDSPNSQQDKAKLHQRN